MNDTERFLSLWDCSTGMPYTEPTDKIFKYKDGDYFMIYKTNPNGKNFMPSGTYHLKDEIQCAIEHDAVFVND